MMSAIIEFLTVYLDHLTKLFEFDEERKRMHINV